MTEDQPDVTVDLLAGLKSAAALDQMTFAPLVEHIPLLVTEGFGILAGSPKVGKSWLAVAIALAVAQGGVALNTVKVKPRHVLLLALEDGDRRLQTRFRIVNNNQPLPGNLDYLTKVTPQTLLATVCAWLAGHQGDENPPLVILDTLGKARPQRRSGEDPYISDYQFGSQLKAIIDAVPGAALLAVHHTRKMNAEDFVSTISGTNGITGAADFVLVLNRKRQSDEGTLSVTGRDIYEAEYAMCVNNGIWRIDGPDLSTAADRALIKHEQDQLGDRALEVLRVVNGRVHTTPADVADELGVSTNQASVYLQRLASAGRIGKKSRGVYVPVGSVESV